LIEQLAPHHQMLKRHDRCRGLELDEEACDVRIEFDWIATGAVGADAFPHLFLPRLIA
jgi:hypothetical protein